MIKLEGPWEKGYAFDIHTIDSVFTGYNVVDRGVDRGTLVNK